MSSDIVSKMIDCIFENFQGRNIYDGCCQLDIQFSKQVLLILTMLDCEFKDLMMPLHWSIFAPFPISLLIHLLWHDMYFYHFCCSLDELQVNYNNDRSR